MNRFKLILILISKIVLNIPERVDFASIICGHGDMGIDGMIAARIATRTACVPNPNEHFTLALS